MAVPSPPIGIRLRLFETPATETWSRSCRLRSPALRLRLFETPATETLQRFFVRVLLRAASGSLKHRRLKPFSESWHSSLLSRLRLFETPATETTGMQSLRCGCGRLRLFETPATETKKMSVSFQSLDAASGSLKHRRLKRGKRQGPTDLPRPPQAL